VILKLEAQGAAACHHRIHAQFDDRSMAKSNLRVTTADPGMAKSNFRITMMLSVALLVVYMAQGILITYSQNDAGGYDYDKNTSVLLSELCKIVLSAGLLYREFQINPNPESPLVGPIFDLSTLSYAVPALLYVVHNNIIFVALELIGPTTYQLFNNLKIVTTGFVFRIFLKRKLRVHQWMAILLLLLGMCVTQMHPTENHSSRTEQPFLGFLWMMALSTCSAFAGVYNEFLIKKDEQSVYWKNIQLYSFGTLACLLSNIVSYLFSGSTSEASAPVEPKGFLHGFGLCAWLVVFLNGVLGQIISLIFKYADNIVKVYAASGAILSTSFISHYLFGTPLTLELCIGIMVALLSMFFYFFSPQVLAKEDSLFCFDIGVSTGIIDNVVAATLEPEHTNDVEDLKRLVDRSAVRSSQ